MKWRCRIFDQDKRFIEQFSWITSWIIYSLNKIRNWVQKNSYPMKNKIFTTIPNNKIPEDKKAVVQNVYLPQNFNYSKTIDFYQFCRYQAKLHLTSLIFLMLICKPNSHRHTKVFSDFWNRFFIFNFLNYHLFISSLFFSILLN